MITITQSLCVTTVLQHYSSTFNKVLISLIIIFTLLNVCLKTFDHRLNQLFPHSLVLKNGSNGKRGEKVKKSRKKNIDIAWDLLYKRKSLGSSMIKFFLGRSWDLLEARQEGQKRSQERSCFTDALIMRSRGYFRYRPNPNPIHILFSTLQNSSLRIVFVSCFFFLPVHVSTFAF